MAVQGVRNTIITDRVHCVCFYPSWRGRVITACLLVETTGIDADKTTLRVGLMLFNLDGSDLTESAINVVHQGLSRSTRSGPDTGLLLRCVEVSPTLSSNGQAKHVLRLNFDGYYIIYRGIIYYKYEEY